MRLYTVHLKPSDPSSSGSSAGTQPAFELVKDGFCWPALFLPFLWALWRGQWTGLLAYLICIMAISTLTVIAAPGEAVEVVLGLGLAILVGFSANDWRRWRLRRLGYRDAGAVAAASATEAELRVLSVLEGEGPGGDGAKSGNGLPKAQPPGGESPPGPVPGMAPGSMSTGGLS